MVRHDRNLIIYYSRKGENYVCGKVRSIVKGNTAIGAGIIHSATWGETFEIETVCDYPEDYNECIALAKRELAEGARPELKNYIKDLSDYDRIFICGPNWWGTFPCAIFSQLEKLDWTGKKVMLFVTHEGGGLGHVEEDVKKICRGAEFGESLAVQGSFVANEMYTISAWASKSVDDGE